MKGTHIFVDALGDFSPNEIMELGIKQFPYSMMIDGESRLSDTVSNDIVCDNLKNGKHISTCRPSNGVWVKEIEESMRKGYDVLYIGSTSKMTGALSTFKIVTNILKTKYPKVKVECIDTTVTAVSIRPFVFEAVKMIKDGKPFDDIVSHLSSMVGKVHYYGVFDSTSTMMGNNRTNLKSNMYPVIVMEDGVIHIESEFETKIKSIDHMLSLIDDCKAYCISNTVDVDDNIVEYVKKRLEEKGEEYPRVDVQPTMYTYVGLGTIGVAVYDK